MHIQVLAEKEKKKLAHGFLEIAFSPLNVAHVHEIATLP